MTQRLEKIEADVRQIKRAGWRRETLLWVSVVLGILKLWPVPMAMPATPPQNHSQSVKIGDSGKDVPEPARDYLKTKEVAEREGVAERTIINWIEGGRLHPAPTRNGKAWVIAADYRVLPPDAADDGTVRD